MDCEAASDSFSCDGDMDDDGENDFSLILRLGELVLTSARIALAVAGEIAIADEVDDDGGGDEGDDITTPESATDGGLRSVNKEMVAYVKRVTLGSLECDSDE